MTVRLFLTIVCGKAQTQPYWLDSVRGRLVPVNFDLPGQERSNQTPYGGCYPPMADFTEWIATRWAILRD